MTCSWTRAISMSVHGLYLNSIFAHCIHMLGKQAESIMLGQARWKNLQSLYLEVCKEATSHAACDHFALPELLEA